MKVMHLSSIDVGGGAIRATNTLHGALKNAGVGSKVLVKRKLGNDTLSLENFGQKQGMIDHLWRRLSVGIDQIPMRFFKTDNTSGHSPAWVPDLFANRQCVALGSGWRSYGAVGSDASA